MRTGHTRHTGPTGYAGRTGPELCAPWKLCKHSPPSTLLPHSRLLPAHRPTPLIRKVLELMWIMQKGAGRSGRRPVETKMSTAEVSGPPCVFLAFAPSGMSSRDVQRLPETSGRGRFVGARISSKVRAGWGGRALAQVSWCAQAGACARSRTLALLRPMCAPPLHVLDSPLVLLDAPNSLPPLRSGRPTSSIGPMRRPPGGRQSILARGPGTGTGLVG